MDFYFNNKQIEELSKFIFDKGGRFIPDLDYKHDKYVTLADNETLKQYLGQTFHFF